MRDSTKLVFDPRAALRLRERAGLSRTQVAAACGCTAQAVGQWESDGGSTPSLDSAIKLADALDVPFRALFSSRKRVEARS